MSEDWQARAILAFRDAFGRDPEVLSDAGGRVNLIGEHTDYHEGFVFPAAIDLRTRAAASVRTDGVIRIRSLNEGAEVESLVLDLSVPDVVDWRAYVLGPFRALVEAGHPVPGADVVVEGQVPFGGGLSSSASVEVALVGLGAALAGVELDAAEVARLARRAENVFCRVPCGAMDQVASACGREGHALILDCRTLEVTHVPWPGSWVMVVADSGVRHSVAGPEYARRQKECARGMDVVRGRYPEVATARDVRLEWLGALERPLGDVPFRRLRHVVTENARVLAARKALSGGDGGAFGRLLAESHQSLARDYEVSCPELDVLVEEAYAIPGCIGARLTGAGFGGNTVNVVHAGEAEAFCDALCSGYRRRTGRSTAVRIVHPACGVRCARIGV
jgi:galactokinase